MRLFVICLIFIKVFITEGYTGNLGGQDGNGGSGPYIDNNYSTFYSAGFYVEPFYLTEKDLPELVSLRKDLEGNCLDRVERVKLFTNNSLLTLDHNYIDRNYKLVVKTGSFSYNEAETYKLFLQF